MEIWNKDNWKEYNDEENFISNDLAFKMENIKDRIEQFEKEIKENEDAIAQIKERNAALNKSVKKLKKVEEQINEIFNDTNDGVDEREVDKIDEAV